MTWFLRISKSPLFSPISSRIFVIAHVYFRRKSPPFYQNKPRSMDRRSVRVIPLLIIAIFMCGIHPHIYCTACNSNHPTTTRLTPSTTSRICSFHTSKSGPQMGMTKLLGSFYFFLSKRVLILKWDMSSFGLDETNWAWEWCNNGEETVKGSTFLKAFGDKKFYSL